MAPARVGKQHLTACRDDAGEEREQRGRVALLVEDVRGEHEIEATASEGRRLPPVEQHALDGGAVPFCVSRQQRERVLGPVRGDDRSSTDRGDERREPEAAAELEHGDATELERRQPPGKRDAAGPALRPVGHELVVREGFLVEQRLRLERPFEHEGERADIHLLDVRLHDPATMPRVKKRLDVLLVERGLAESRSQAQALVLAGLVPGFEKPGQQVDDATEVAVRRPPRFVSRGGEKLAHALDALHVDPAGLDCLDVGASTGGFTDCLLQRGARRVIALDVGYGQLHPRIRGDERVTVIERTNVRTVAELPFPPQLVVCDVSFISVRVALPPALELAAPGWVALVLVKPQFEAGREDAPKGVVRDREVHVRVLQRVCREAADWNAAVLGVVDSGLPGPKGTREFIVHLRESENAAEPDDVDRWIEAAVG